MPVRRWSQRNYGINPGHRLLPPGNPDVLDDSTAIASLEIWGGIGDHQEDATATLSLVVSLCLSLYLFRYLSISFYLFPSLSIHPSVRQTACLSVGSSVSLSVCLFLDRRFLCNSHQGVNRVGGGRLRDAGCERGKVKRTQRY